MTSTKIVGKGQFRVFKVLPFVRERFLKFLVYEKKKKRERELKANSLRENMKTTRLSHMKLKLKQGER